MLNQCYFCAKSGFVLASSCSLDPPRHCIIRTRCVAIIWFSVRNSDVHSPTIEILYIRFVAKYERIEKVDVDVDVDVDVSYDFITSTF